MSSLTCAPNCLPHCLNVCNIKPLHSNHSLSHAPFQCNIKLELSKLGHSTEYIERSLRVYHKHYGVVYDKGVLSEIIYRLKIKDEIKLQKKICNTFHSKINLLTKLESLGFAPHFSNKIISKYANTNKPYHFDIIAREILKLRGQSSQKMKPKHIHTKHVKNNVPILPNEYKLDKLICESNKSNSETSVLSTVSDTTEATDTELVCDDTVYIHSSLSTFNDTVHINMSVDNSNAESTVLTPPKSKSKDSFTIITPKTMSLSAISAHASLTDIDKHCSHSQDIVQTSIDNFPTFEYNKNNEINITVAQCAHKNICDCQSFIRINYILYCYQLWISSNYDSNKCGFYKVINRCNYNNSKLLDDAHHLCKWHAFDEIYNGLQWECNFTSILECKMFTRNNYNKSSFNNVIKNSLYFDSTDDEEINIEQICDVLHCYILHSYDLGLKLRRKQRKEIREVKEENIMSGETLKLNKIKRILNKKKCNITNCKKYTTLLEKNESIAHFEYFDKSNNFYVRPIYETLKSELLMNGISINEWNKLNIRALNIQQKQYSRLLKAGLKNTYAITQGSIISTYHIIALLVVCNFPIIQRTLFETFTFVCTNMYNVNGAQIRSKLIQNHAKYALLSRILFESVHIFGDTTHDSTQSLYHCFNKSIYFSSNIISISSPLSISANIKTILNVNNSVLNNNECLVVKLSDNSNCNLRYFDCSLSFISDWIGEEEIFMIGNSPFRKEIFKVEGIIEIVHNNYIRDYSKWLISIEIIVKFITGWTYDTLSLDSEITSNATNIFVEMANIMYLNDSNPIPYYIKELMYKYSINIYEIEIDWFCLHKYYSFFTSFLCFNRKNMDFISFSVLLNVFPNCQKLSINGGMSKRLTLNRNIITYLFDFLSSNMKFIQLREIVFWNVALDAISGYFSLKQVCQSYAQQFQTINWIIKTEIVNDFESLILQRYS